jgi:uncharacterized membrane protein YeaQ/YmgE (transglycosylase-associated protein family)
MAQRDAICGYGETMSIVGLIIAGIAVGLLGRLLHPGRDPIGILATIAIGVVAVLVVGLLLHGTIGFFGYVLAVIVAAVLVALFNRVVERRRLA